MGEFSTGEINVGLANSKYARNYLDRCGHDVDYIEIALEQLKHDPSIAELYSDIQIVLHCASLSLASSVNPSRETLNLIDHWIRETNTPWLGEHLAFIDAKSDGEWCEETIHVEFTVNPDFNQPILHRVLENVQKAETKFKTHVLLENGPIYFDSPLSTYSQNEFFCVLCESHNIKMLLDPTHLTISARNRNENPITYLKNLPLADVVEIHLSGAKFDNGLWWDDHSRFADDEMLELLSGVLELCSPRAVTLEYNWPDMMPFEELALHIEGVRKICQL